MTTPKEKFHTILATYLKRKIYYSDMIFSPVKVLWAIPLSTKKGGLSSCAGAVIAIAAISCCAVYSLKKPVLTTKRHTGTKYKCSERFPVLNKMETRHICSAGADNTTDTTARKHPKRQRHLADKTCNLIVADRLRQYKDDLGQLPPPPPAYPRQMPPSGRPISQAKFTFQYIHAQYFPGLSQLGGAGRKCVWLAWHT
jgi:hypothetical protein